VRVSTSVRKEDGSRAVGTKLNRARAAWRKALDGDEYAGRALPFGTDYMTRYVPFRDTSGAVAGITFIGYDISVGLEALKDRVVAARLGQRGYRIVCCNDAVIQLLQRAQDSMRKSLPGFGASQLVGGSIDQFHCKPEHRRGILAQTGKSTSRGSRSAAA
jgi:hypothetical protein